MLLKKGLLLIPASIFFITLCTSNISNANSISDTKDRIKEIKIVEEINVEKLIRNKEIKLENTYIRNIQTTSRSEVDRDTNKEIKAVEQKESYIEIKNIKISKNMDLTKRTGLSKSDFKRLIKNVSQDTSKFFYDNADTIYDLCEKYQINEIFFCGLISAESGWNIAGNHRRTHNYISLMSNGKLIQYSSTKQGLEVAAQKLHYNYLTPGGKFYGGKTLAGVKKKFCPSGTWVDLVYGRMNQIMSAAKKCK